MKTNQENIERYQQEAFDIGCYLDRSASSAVSLEKDTISFAAQFGFDIGEPLPDEDDEDYYQALSDTGWEAVEYLNELEDREGFFWTFEENSLFLASDANEDDSDVSDRVITGQNALNNNRF